MKPGSIVVVIKRFTPDLQHVNPNTMRCVKWLPIADESTTYIVKDVYTQGSTVASLEEGYIGKHPSYNTEIGIVLDYLKEVLPPQSSEELLKQLQPEELVTI